MSLKRFNDFPDGSGSLTSDDIFLFMDDPSNISVTKKISLSQLSSAIGGGGISNLVEDSTPQLGGNLDLNSYSINGTGSINLFGSGNFTQGLFVNNTGISITGHSHTSSNISDFNTAVSGLLPTIPNNLADDHDVSITGVAHNDVLVYNSGTQYWENNSKVVFSDTTGIAGASGVSNIVQISQSDYDNLGSYTPNTIYFIT